MANTYQAVAAMHGAPRPQAGSLPMALTLMLIAAGYLALAWDTLPWLVALVGAD